MRAFVLALLLAPLLLIAGPLQAAPPRTEQAVLAGGCFWCMETDMQGPGVISVESGYTGGTLVNPKYEDVLTEKTGHYEAVRVTYDPTRISYARVLQKYWKLVDPTDDGGQFCDRGSSYRPAVFASPAQKPLAEASRAAAAKDLKQGTMKAQILPLGAFYPAEAYHRDFAKKNSLHYSLYRAGCRRDARLAAVWGKAPH